MAATNSAADGAPVRLSDVAEVIDSTENIRNEGQANGKRSVLVIINLQPNANIIETVDQVKALLPELQATDGFLSVERFESLAQPGRYLSLSFWRDEAAVRAYLAGFPLESRA